MAGNPQKVGEGMEHSPSQTPEGTSPDDPLISDFWPPELRENTLLLFKATLFVVLCHSSLRTLMHQGTVMTIFIGAHTLACALISIYMSLSLDCPSDPLSWVFKVLVASPRPGIETEAWLLIQGTLPSCRARIPTQPCSLCPPQVAWFVHCTPVAAMPTVLYE